MTAHDHDPIRPTHKGLGNDSGIHPAGAHEADDPNIGGVLHPGNSSEVSRGVPSPGAAENQDPRGEVSQGVTSLPTSNIEFHDVYDQLATSENVK
jgi:hypothetical protein